MDLPWPAIAGLMHGQTVAQARWTTWWAPRPAATVEAWQDFHATLAWLLGLQLLDLFTTLGALSNGAAEANPFAASVFSGSGALGLVAFKAVAFVLMLGWVPTYSLVQRPGQGRSPWAVAVLGLVLALALLYSVVVVNNLAVLHAILRS